jgi:hypothetical protein
LLISGLLAPRNNFIAATSSVPFGFTIVRLNDLLKKRLGETHTLLLICESTYCQLIGVAQIPRPGLVLYQCWARQPYSLEEVKPMLLCVCACTPRTETSDSHPLPLVLLSLCPSPCPVLPTTVRAVGTLGCGATFLPDAVRVLGEFYRILEAIDIALVARYRVTGVLEIECTRTGITYYFAQFV